ncbi:MAG: tripartite tricarboxylate transporter substrate binding protein, partial [Betaproteobacteria bacterium]|nr:tripartite tricarboxylate transporter substrate binding protein [Betaproteobacteria bacterium]
MPRRQLILSSAAALASSMLSAHAQPAQFADRPIKLVVPTAVGGGNDTTGRIYAEKVTSLLKRPVLVENLPGA